MGTSSTSMDAPAWRSTGDPPGPPDSQRSARSGTLEETPGTAEVQRRGEKLGNPAEDSTVIEKWYPLVI